MLLLHFTYQIVWTFCIKHINCLLKLHYRLAQAVVNNSVALSAEMAISWLCVLAAIASINQLVMADVDYIKYGLIPTLPGSHVETFMKRTQVVMEKMPYYVVQTDRPSFVYCDMTLSCGGEKGWMRIADVNPAKGSCPNGWRKITTPVVACRSPNDNGGCFSAHFPTLKIPYSRVCGKLIGIQKGTPDGFVPGNSHRSIDDTYLDGISLTYGGYPRKHVWSFAGSPAENNGRHSCPCSKDRGTLPLL